MNRLHILPALTLFSLTALSACSLSSSGPECIGVHCSANPTGPTHGVTADGRVDVDATQAWPKRPIGPVPVSAEDVAKACAAYGACLSTFVNPPSTSTDDQALAMATSLCTLPDGAEERVVPMGDKNERWSWWIRAIVANPNCDAIGKLKSDRAKDLYCEEDGCWWTSARPVVKCEGPIATLATPNKTYVRDCTRSYAECDASSATGCTDRPPVSCDPKGRDRCDGDVKLGCDGNGLVSFHDCSLVGGKCLESADGAKCVPKIDAGCELSTQGCDGNNLSLCVFGGKTTIDCTAIGFAGCSKGHCTLK